MYKLINKKNFSNNLLIKGFKEKILNLNKKLRPITKN